MVSPVKCQSNAEIAGSPRNAFGCSVTCFVLGVEQLNGLGGLPAYRTQPNSEYQDVKRSSETARDKLRGQKENSPDRQLRAVNID